MCPDAMEASKFRRLTGVPPTVFAQMRAAALAGAPPSSHPAGGDGAGQSPSRGWKIGSCC